MGARVVATRVLAVAVVAAAVLVAAGLAAAQAAAAYTGPNAIAVPYTEEKVVKPADGWTFQDCGAIAKAGGALVVACDPSTGFTVKSPGYDPDFGEVIVPVKMTNGRTSTTIDYVLSLEPPAVPELAEMTYPHPAPAGGTLLIPISDLGITCTACSAGSGLEVTSFAPVGAATVLPTETHLVVRPRAGFEGPLEITIRAGDMYGGWSSPTVITVPVSRLDEDAPVPQHVQRPLAAEASAFDLPGLVHFPAGPDDAQILCGSAIHGTVVCDAAGTATYTPFEKAQVDQFSFHVAQNGDYATGSVTLVAEDAEVGLPAKGLAVSEPRTSPTPAPTPAPDPEPEETDDPDADPADEDAKKKDEEKQEQQMVLLRVASPLVPASPPDETGGMVGVFTPLVETMNRAGAR